MQQQPEVERDTMSRSSSISILEQELDRIKRSGDVYQQRTKVNALLEELGEIIRNPSHKDATRIQSLVQEAQNIHKRLSNLNIGQSEDSGGNPQVIQSEVVGDIDELLAELTLTGAEDGATHASKVLHMIPGRRYKRVVRRDGSGAKVEFVGAGQRSLDRRDGTGDIDARTHEVQNRFVDASEEEKKRYPKLGHLSVEIPVQEDVIVAATQQHPSERQQWHKRDGSEGSTLAQEGAEGNDSDSDESITSPDGFAVRTLK